MAAIDMSFEAGAPVAVNPIFISMFEDFQKDPIVVDVGIRNRVNLFSNISCRLHNPVLSFIHVTV